MKNWPIYKDQLLVVGNPESNIAVATCWTDREVIARQLSMDRIAAVGNLYTSNRGLDYLVANVLAHPYISQIFVAGADKQNGGQALLNFVRSGFEEGLDETERACWRIKNTDFGRLSKDFSSDDLEAFRESVIVYDFRSITPAEVDESISIRYEAGVIAREPREVLLSEITASKAFPNYAAGQRIVGTTVAEVWLKALEYILRFGVVSNTQYQSLQQETLDLVSVITGEDPYNPLVPEWFPFGLQWFQAEYLPGVLERKPVQEGVSYSYGDRMRVRWGDQVDRVIEKLRDQPDTRQAVVDLWDNDSDLSIKESPCLNHLWFRVQAGKLYLTATIRSNDMYRAFPANALSLRALQAMVRDETDPGLSLGDLVIISQSAHIYDETLDEAQKVLEQHRLGVIRDERMIVDPAGMFVISVEDDLIKVKHLTPIGTFLQEFTGRTAMSLYLKIAPFVSITEHALYLGAELEKAEVARTLSLRYEQDKRLVFV